MSFLESAPLYISSRVHVLGEIDEKSALEAIQLIYNINAYDSLQEKDKKDYVRDPITLVINSIGGNAYDAIAIMGAIQLSKTEVHAIGLGAVMSSAIDVFVACHQRFAHKMTRFMYHEISTNNEGKIQDQSMSIEESNITQAMADSVLVSKTKLTKKKLDDIKKKKIDWYFSAAEAHKLGLVEEILE